MKGYYLMMFIMCIPFLSKSQQISIFGTATPANDWDTDYPMTNDIENPDVLTINLALSVGAVKFREFSSTTAIWGSDSFPSGVATLGGPEIPISTPGYYVITFNQSTLSFSFEIQNSITATYNAGNIPSNYSDYDNSCYGNLTLTLPPGDNYTISGGMVSYTMLAIEPGWKSDQRSKISFENTQNEEALESAGSGNVEGTFNYSRSLDLANGQYAGGTELTFRLSAKRTYEGVPDCNTLTQRVDNDTWTITLYYSAEMPYQRVGINAVEPAATLEVKGRIMLSDDTSTPLEGTIRWNSAAKDFEGFDGLKWVSFTKNNTNKDWGREVVNESNGRDIIDLDANSLLGKSVAIGENYAIAGAYGENANAGNVYLYRKSGNSWLYYSVISNSFSNPGDKFGYSVAISGDYAIIGAPERTVGGNVLQGQAYIYFRTGNVWNLQATLNASNGLANDKFGYDVSISGDYALITAVTTSPNGKAYIFKRSGITWIQQSQLIPAVPATHYGGSCALNGNYAVIGADGRFVGADIGKAIVFTRIGNTWIEQATLLASNGFSQAEFGYDVAIYGNTIVVGSKDKDANSITQSGAAYVFERSNTTWTETAYLFGSDLYYSDRFGWSVSVYENTIVIGAIQSGVGGTYKGKAYIYEKNNSEWQEKSILQSSDGKVGDLFGSSTSIWGNQIMIGSPYYDNNGVTLETGKTYFFTKSD